MNSSTGLRRFVSGPPTAAQAGAVPIHARPDQTGAPAEKCDLCATEVAAEHGHLADLDQSSLLCACRACYLLFTHTDAARGRYRAVPDRYLTDPDHPLSTAEWDELEVPVGLAFFLRSSRQSTVTGFYPSPAGATECRLDLSAWDRLTAAHPLLGAAAPDVEAVLITRTGQGPSGLGSSSLDPSAPGSAGSAIECFVVPIDACYELAGRMRLHWRGFDGGTEARSAIAAFLDDVRGRARTLDQGS